MNAHSEEEFAVSHLAGAVRVAPESNASAALCTLAPERPIVIYCSAGYRGATLARRLQEAGRGGVWNLEGGIFAWANAGLPIERAGESTKRVHPYSRFLTRLLKPQIPDVSEASWIFIRCSRVTNKKDRKKGSNMKARNTMSLVTMIGVIALLSATDASAQGRGANRGSGGWGPRAAYNSKYDPKTVETLSGEVISVDRITPEKGMSYGLHLMLKTGKESISVHLGPGWYIERQDTQINVKDAVQIKGSRIMFEGKPAIIAAEVKKGDEVLQLRDETGVPNWSGWRRR